jgi:hypothetical protein
VSDEKTPARTPYAIAVEEIVTRQIAALKVDLARMIRDSAAQTALMIGNALGAWRAEVDQSLNDHEGRLLNIERTLLPDVLSRLRVLESDRPTEPPEPPTGMQS